MDYEELQTQIDIFQSRLEVDEENIFNRMDVKKIPQLISAEELFKALDSSLQNSSCYDSWIAMLRHFCLTPSNPLLKCVRFLGWALNKC